jgi:hypothetical protein
MEQENYKLFIKEGDRQELTKFNIPAGKIIHSTIEDDGIKFTLLLGIRGENVYILDSIVENVF